ncbi:MAG TPA: hypothetical protein VNF29_02145 [Candidatus Binataceae bacterium]|nr:hypothetical protein [Candidatus Binataceae bacterium]
METEQAPPFLDGPRRNIEAASGEPAVSGGELAADRKNPRHSTGPRTARGKARSALNSFKDGILTRAFVIPKLEGRSAAREFDAMLQGLIADLVPVGMLEKLMVQEIGVCTWRLRRVLKYENRAAFLNSLEWEPETDNDGDYKYESERTLDQAGLNDLSIPDPQEVTAISRYENGLMRHLFRAMDRLERMQRQRRAGAVEGETGKPNRTLRSRENPQQIERE